MNLPPFTPSVYESMNGVVAHRGASGHAPENTAAAIQLAAHQGANWVEIDVTLSDDGIAIIHHDETLNRCSNGTGWVAQHTVDQLKALDAGSWFAAEFAEQQILTLPELLTLCDELDLGLNIEVKPVIGLEDETISAIEQAIHGHAVRTPILLSSFNLRALQGCRRHLPHIPRGLNVEAIPLDWQQRLQEVEASSLHFQHHFFNRRRVEAICNAGYHTLAFTVNDPDQARDLIQSGVTAVFTDYPATLLPYTQKTTTPFNLARH